MQARTITIRLPECPICGSVVIKCYRTTGGTFEAHGETRYYACECGERFRAIVENPRPRRQENPPTVGSMKADTRYALPQTHEQEAQDMVSTGTDTLESVGEIARRYGVPTHRVTYLIEERAIEAAGRAGNARLFNREAVERIGAELAKNQAATK